jgi:hypothetical protein
MPPACRARARGETTVLRRSPSERALDARSGEGRVNAAATIDGDIDRSDGGYLALARRLQRREEAEKKAKKAAAKERERAFDAMLLDTPRHPVGRSPVSERRPPAVRSILPPLAPQIQEESETTSISSRSPARVGTAPVTRSSIGNGDGVSHVIDFAYSSSTSDAPAENPGHNALTALGVLSPSFNQRGTKGKEHRHDSTDKSDGQPGPSNYSGR